MFLLGWFTRCRTDEQLQAAAARISAACHGPAWERLSRRTLVMSASELRGYLRARTRALVHEYVSRAESVGGRLTDSSAALADRVSDLLVARLTRDVQTMPVRLRQRQAA